MPATDMENESPASGTASPPSSTEISSKEVSDEPTSAIESAGQVGKSERGFRFWMVFVSLCVTSLLAALEGTVVSTALPTIARDLGLGENYAWVANVYFLTNACFQPFFGQTANIFGRRYLMISFVVLFMLGSGIAGGAYNPAMLLAGRAVQGIGGGGINMFIELIVCDLVPLRERGNFMGMIFAVFAIGTSVGPVIGGIIADHSSWRWVFYINLPIAGVALILLIMFLQVKYDKETTFKQKVKRIDFAGNAIVVGSVVAILIALSWGGTRYEWTSGAVLAPLILGICGLGAFMVFEASPFAKEPTTPPYLFANRTSAVAFFQTFIHGLLSFWILYMLPVYFQGVLRSSPARSGVQLLPTVVALIPVSAVTGAVMTKTGKYRIFHLIGFALFIIGLGSFTILDADSSTAVWAVTQIIAAAGSGIVLPTLLPAVQAGLDEKDVATSTATWAFVRSLGIIWGLSIPAAIFNNQFDKLSYRISDPTVRSTLINGDAYAYASGGLVNSLPRDVQQEVTGVFSDSLKLVWQVSIAFAGFSFLLTFLEKNIKMRTELETEFGLKNREKKGEKSIGGSEV